MNVPDKFCIAGDHGKWRAELMGNISDDFLSKNIDAGQSLAEKSDRFRQFAELILAVYIGAGGKSFSASRSTVCLIAKIGFVKYPEPTAARMDAAMVRTTVRMISCIRLKVKAVSVRIIFSIRR